MESQFLQIADIQVEVANYHQDFLILRSEDKGALGRLGKALFLRKFEFVDEVIATETEVLLKLNRKFSHSRLSLLAEVELPDADSTQVFTLPVFFDVAGDWETVMAQTGLEKEELVEKLIKPAYSVAMLGFLPGFAYLNGLPLELQVPRKAVPAKYVEAGSLAIGGKYLGLYAIDSPGGWHVVGKTPLRILELPNLPPVPFLPGDQFRIHPIGSAEYEQLLAHPETLTNYHARS